MQIQITRVSNQALSVLVMRLAEGAQEIDAAELLRLLQHWYADEARRTSMN